MYAGRIMELSSVEELFRTTLHPYTIGLLQSLPDKRGVPLKPISGFVSSPDLYPKGCKFSDRCPRVIDTCRITEPELVEVAQGHYVRCIRVEIG
jgi:oligopeptide/dipeptide ABC transporter ATP-binding protein